MVPGRHDFMILSRLLPGKNSICAPTASWTTDRKISPERGFVRVKHHHITACGKEIPACSMCIQPNRIFAASPGNCRCFKIFITAEIAKRGCMRCRIAKDREFGCFFNLAVTTSEVSSIASQTSSPSIRDSIECVSHLIGFEIRPGTA